MTKVSELMSSVFIRFKNQQKLSKNLQKHNGKEWTRVVYSSDGKQIDIGSLVDEKL